MGGEGWRGGKHGESMPWRLMCRSTAPRCVCPDGAVPTVYAPPVNRRNTAPRWLAIGTGFVARFLLTWHAMSLQIAG